MNEEEINEIVKEHYGFTIDELDNSVGYWADKITNKTSEIKQLEQENRQLKEQLENNDCKRIYNQFVNYKNWYLEYVNRCEEYKSVLDEIREYIETHVKEHIHDDYDVTLYNSLNQDECDELLQILDKVKE